MLQEEIVQKIEAEIIAQGYELVRISSNLGVVNIVIDQVEADKSINIKDCGKVHKHIINVLGDDFCSKNSIEVSSPGIDRGLFKIADYVKFVGRKIRINFSNQIPQPSTKQDSQSTEKVSDKLGLMRAKKINCIIKSVDVNKNLIKLEYNDTEIDVDFSFIISAKLALPDDLFNK